MSNDAAAVAVADAPVAATSGTTPVPQSNGKAKKKKNPTVSSLVFITYLKRVNGEKTPAECAKDLGMEPGSFDQRLYDARKQFRTDKKTRTEFAALYPKDADSEDGLGEYPDFLNLKDGRGEGGTGRPAGEKMRDALRKLLAGETTTVDEV